MGLKKDLRKKAAKTLEEFDWCNYGCDDMDPRVNEGMEGGDVFRDAGAEVVDAVFQQIWDEGVKAGRNQFATGAIDNPTWHQR